MSRFGDAAWSIRGVESAQSRLAMQAWVVWRGAGQSRFAIPRGREGCSGGCGDEREDRAQNKLIGQTWSGSGVDGPSAAATPRRTARRRP
ncbi:hypothetical protein HPP92_007034 [Vanilla planifolia]|uniref:Uncharacterized protein n=1 Tax=Vanilla planifolia TaxID=51239 RepID=A0A835RJN5_VANPL|nr:hypothetical protein HPP92_007292 [Vanilla planifolia]KAG0490171.1 hypothetical protein HPP92_007034 [Vanilla planifolia]